MLPPLYFVQLFLFIPILGGTTQAIMNLGPTKGKVIRMFIVHFLYVVSFLNCAKRHFFPNTQSTSKSPLLQGRVNKMFTHPLPQPYPHCEKVELTKCSLYICVLSPLYNVQPLLPPAHLLAIMNSE